MQKSNYTFRTSKKRVIYFSWAAVMSERLVRPIYRHRIVFPNTNKSKCSVWVIRSWATAACRRLFPLWSTRWLRFLFLLSNTLLPLFTKCFGFYDMLWSAITICSCCWQKMEGLFWFRDHIYWFVWDKNWENLFLCHSLYCNEGYDIINVVYFPAVSIIES